jgi:hypothetical protein
MGVTERRVVLDQQRLHSLCRWTAQTITADCVRVCHSLMSRGKREVLEGQLLHARVRLMCAVCVDIADMYRALLSCMYSSLKSARGHVGTHVPTEC